MKRIILGMCILISLCTISTVQANLMISPTRLNFDSRDRVQEVILINSGKVERTYRLSWTENKATPKGGYQSISVDDPSVDALSPFIRFSPRQVRLAPGERQIIKLQLRKKPGMDSSEYRSHLKFTALPPEEEASAQPKQASEGMSFKLNLLMNYTIPVLYHPEKGNVAIDVAYEGVSLREDGSADLKVKLMRSGDVSAFGRLELYAQIDGDTKQIGLANNISVFRELNHRYAHIRVPEYNKIANKLTDIEIKYVGEKEHVGQVFASNTFNFSPFGE